MTYPRLDEWLVSSGHYPTRAKARDAIKRGCVSFSDNLSAKPSRSVTDPKLITIDDPAQAYVSRAALKLEQALDQTGLTPDGKIALDLGASTGGFCQILLNRGATHVYAIDVGHDQMDQRLRNHPQLTNLEGLNARDLTLSDLDGNRPEFITSDVSFISLKLALPKALEIAAPGATGVFLVKPQFEVGKEHLGKGGIVREEGLSERTAVGLQDWLSVQPDWEAKELLLSPISGGDGNIEYLLIGQKNG